jgi:hypothetical protein
MKFVEFDLPGVGLLASPITQHKDSIYSIDYGMRLQDFLLIEL